MQNAGEPARTDRADFSLNELFFSRTDTGGIIKAGNSVFQRVSEYPADDLWNKPHKLIRHRDTPRGVFYKLWSSLKAGRPIAAYVKNSSRSGRYYWVYAVVAPIEDGYLSIRLKPTSRMFEEISRFYVALADRERSEKLDPSSGADLIDETVTSRGFKSYEAFMAAALKQEQDARDEGLGKGVSQLSVCFDKLQDSARALSAHIRSIATSLDSVKNTPFNLRIFASQMGSVGKALAVIATNYVTILQELRAQLDEFDAAASDITDSLDEALLLNFIVKLQREMIAFFEQERDTGDGVDKAAEAAQLERLCSEFSQQAETALGTIRKRCLGLPAACYDMKRHATVLDVIRLTAKVEMSNKEQNDGIILELEQRLEACQEALREALNSISTESTQTLNAVNNIMRLETSGRRQGEGEARPLALAAAV